MGEIIHFNNTVPASENSENVLREDQVSILSDAEEMLTEARKEIGSKTTLSMPIAQLATLGAGVSSLIPAFHNVTSTVTFSESGLYRVINAAAGEGLKASKDKSFFWGALKSANGGSKMARLVEAGPLSSTSEAAAAFDPTTLLVAVALFGIEQELGNIANMEKQILSFLESEKESEVEADVRTLGKIIDEYKYNWDNEHYVASNHKMVLDIQRTAQKNMISYQKAVTEIVSEKKHVSMQNKVNAAEENFLKKFKYYRLSLFTFSMASLLEIMLGGNYNEEYIARIQSELENYSHEYRELFAKASVYMEELNGISIEANVWKGVGKASNAVGKFIGKIPVVEKGLADEFLQYNGSKMVKKAESQEADMMAQLASVSNPNIRVFIDKMEDMIQIFNHTSKIYADNEQIYFVAG